VFPIVSAVSSSHQFSTLATIKFKKKKQQKKMRLPRLPELLLHLLVVPLLVGVLTTASTAEEATAPATNKGNTGDQHRHRQDERKGDNQKKVVADNSHEDWQRPLKLLVYVWSFAYSHMKFQLAVADALIEAGHEVVGLFFF
jgi:hypothetical protein